MYRDVLATWMGVLIGMTVMGGCSLFQSPLPAEGLFPNGDQLAESDDYVLAYLKENDLNVSTTSIAGIMTSEADRVADYYQANDQFGPAKVAARSWDVRLVSDTVAYLAVLPGGLMIMSAGMVDDSTGVTQQELQLLTRHAVIHNLEEHFRSRLRGILLAEYGGMRHQQALKTMSYRYARDILIACGGISGENFRSYNRERESEVAQIEDRFIPAIDTSEPDTTSGQTATPSMDVTRWIDISVDVPALRQFMLIHPHKQVKVNRR